VHELLILAYKVESFDSECFKEDLVNYAPNSILLLFNANGVWVAYKPENLEIKGLRVLFLRCKNGQLSRVLLPFEFFVNNLKILMMFFSFCLKYRVNIILIENTVVAGMMGILRRLNIVKKMIYVPGDWLCDKNKKGLSYMGANILFPLFDYLSCRFSDSTLNCTDAIIEARHDYWRKKTISRSEKLYKSRLTVKGKFLQSSGNKVVFLGNVRDDSGLDLAIKGLGILRQNLDIGLKIIGEYNERHVFLRNLAREYGLKDKIEFMGFLKREAFGGALSDCFCGINLISSEGSYTSKTLPAKVMDFIQYVLPVVVTENTGYVAEIIKKHRIGIVIRPDERQFAQALREIYMKQAEYRDNILTYINETDWTTMDEIFG
jgi:glycosyltransferase involved in cell wall biosynthesis